MGRTKISTLRKAYLAQPELMAKHVKQAISIKQRDAADNYLAGMTKKDALVAAGYSESSYALFKDPIVMMYMEDKLERLTRKHNVTADKIIQEYAKLGFSNIGDLMAVQDNGDVVFDLSRLSKDETAAIQEYVVETYMEGRGEGAKEVKKVRVKMSDKKSALDSLARLKGLFKDKVEVSGQLSVVELLQQGRERARAK